MSTSVSKPNLFRLPFVVSITTRSNCLSSASECLSRVESANPFFLLISSPRNPECPCPKQIKGLLFEAKPAGFLRPHIPQSPAESRQRRGQNSNPHALTAA